MLAILQAHSLEFYIFAAVAVTLTGISKSGFSGGVGAITVAIIAIYMSPLKAAAIMLPILCVMDCLAFGHTEKIGTKKPSDHATRSRYRDFNWHGNFQLC